MEFRVHSFVGVADSRAVLDSGSQRLLEGKALGLRI